VYFKYTKYTQIVFQLQNTHYLCYVNKVQNTLNVFLMHILITYISVTIQHCFSIAIVIV